VKRFWADVTVADGPGGHAVLLDGRGVRTPARAPLAVPSAPLADAIAAEWAAQPDDVDPRAMPLTGLANAAIDHVAANPAAFAATLTPYAETDLLCYRDDRDPALTEQQATAWNPLLTWAEGRFGVEFTLTTGVIHVAQPAVTIAVL
jgi:chaperone required for assembly of F1-ATPase